ncbi:hypothetical protein ERX46_12230 [Brumimicrobium glaciale]|jgi:hypothetical protein|uniref:Lipocalin-like domain-containing protein n=1 Tax=Brumimicrobium glaciale TaxID=200475 RepID=A0A4Q4KHY9_9FLAO|nr:hypothetical protein [Brumimicrobium glaciale]RYM32822.1 hypothetical protein ERX46_12230 [Brumimicrobium glaciale]
MKQFLTLFIASTLLFTISVGCKKISTPNDESRKLFGSWNYHSNSGGFTGAGGSTKYCTGSWIEFTEKGFFRVYEEFKEKKKTQVRYKIEMKESIHSADKRSAIVYKNGSYDTYQIEDNKLYISDDNYDGFLYVFTRK